VTEELRAAAWARYPDFHADALRRDLGALHDWPAAGILVGNGSNELLDVCLAAMTPPGAEVLGCEPSFGLYRMMVLKAGGVPRFLPAGRDLRLPLAALLAELRAAGRDPRQPLLVCSPNNPTGDALAAADVEALLALQQGPLLLDNAYGEFCRHDYRPLLDRYPHLVLLRTFSKAWGLAGLRLGYLLADPRLVAELLKTKLPYNLGHAGILAGRAAVAAAPLARRRVAVVVARRAQWHEMLAAAGCEVLPSEANFLLVRCVGPAAAHALRDGLAERGIRVRDVGGYPGLAGCLRISVGSGAALRATRRALAELAAAGVHPGAALSAAAVDPSAPPAAAGDRVAPPTAAGDRLAPAAAAADLSAPPAAASDLRAPPAAAGGLGGSVAGAAVAPTMAPLGSTPAAPWLRPAVVGASSATSPAGAPAPGASGTDAGSRVDAGPSSGRRGVVERATGETRVRLALALAGGPRRVVVGNGFFGHMLEALATHGGLGLEVEAKGDLHVDLHHTVEDVGIAFGEALVAALGERRGIVRFGSAYAPLDEALARAVVDLSGRGFFAWSAPPDVAASWVTAEFPLTLVADFFQAVADRGRLTLHLDLLAARNGHHAAEAAFKAAALALRQAVALRPVAPAPGGGGSGAGAVAGGTAGELTADGGGEVPSTKGTLTS
jgi:histidinol-phosphate aminotransferase